MRVYDFDGTIYKGDSTLDFYRYSIARHPALIRYSVIALCGAVLYKLGIIKKKQFKGMFFSFIRGINDVEGMVSSFWDYNQDKMKKWYLKQKQSEDVIVSASPDFLLSEICKRLGIKSLIASHVDPYTGIFLGENCYGDEKVRRFKKVFGDATISEFYSDSISDLPMALLAKKSYLVDGDYIKVWVCAEGK